MIEIYIIKHVMFTHVVCVGCCINNISKIICSSIS